MPLLISHRAGGSAVGRATLCELDGPGSIRTGSKLFSVRKIHPDWPWSPPSLLQFVPGLFRMGQSAGARCS